MIPSRRTILMGHQQYRYLPQNLVSSQHTLLEDFDDSTDWTATGDGCVVADDAVNIRTGTSALKMTTGAGIAGIASKTIDPTVFNPASIRLMVYVYDRTKVGAINILLGNEPDAWTNYFQLVAPIGQGTFGTGLVNGWNAINIIQSDWQVVNAASFANPIQRLRVQVTPVAGQVAVVSFDRLATGVAGLAAVVLTYDDPWASIFTLGFPILQRRRLRATEYVVTDNIGLAAYQKAAELSTLYRAGWDIANHTKTHPDLTTLSQADAATEMTAAQAVLDGNGWTRASRHFAYPLGAYNDTVLAAMTDAGMLTGRSTKYQRYELLPVSHTYTLTCPFLENTINLATAQGWIDRIAARGEVLILGMHKLVDGVAGGGEWPVADLQALVDYIAARHIPFLTISELYALQSSGIRIPV